MDEHLTGFNGLRPVLGNFYPANNDEVVVPTDAESAARYAAEIQEATRQLEQARAAQQKTDTRDLHIAYESYINTIEMRRSDLYVALAMLEAKPSPPPPPKPERVWRLDDDDWADVRLMLDDKNLPEELTSQPGWGFAGSIEAREWVQAHPQAVLLQGHIYAHGPPPIATSRPDTTELAWELHRQIMRQREDEMDRRHNFNAWVLVYTVTAAAAGGIVLVAAIIQHFMGF